MSTSFGNKTLADFGFAPLLDAFPITCLDVGARGGITSDLLPLAPAVRAIGFEPDPDECARLNATTLSSGAPWKELRFLPVALGKAKETRALHIYSQPGCSSFLTADVALAENYSRSDYYDLVKRIEAPTMTADAAAREHGFADAAYLKLDVQGGEMDILHGSQDLLRRALLALRVEVSFVPVYKEQPLFSDIECELRKYGFRPMRFLELHHWRRSCKTKLPRLDNGPFPFSEGQMIHGDVLFLKDPDAVTGSGDDATENSVRAALIALAYGFVDHATATFEQPAVKAMLHSRFGIGTAEATSALSCHLARRYTKTDLAFAFRGLWQRLRK